MLQSNDGHELGSSQATNPVAGIELPKVYDNGGKRLLDLSLILLALPFLIPVMVLVALAVMLDGGSPIYTQNRLGRGWRSFRLYKFRHHEAPGRSAAGGPSGGEPRRPAQSGMPIRSCATTRASPRSVRSCARARWTSCRS